MDEQNKQYSNTEECHSYENGSTRPPKNHSGIIAVALCCIIFLSGIISALSMWNKEEALPTESTGGASFSGSDNHNSSNNTNGTNLPQTTPNLNGNLKLELAPLPGQVENIPQVGGLGLQEIYEKNIPSVVSISCTMANGSGSGTGVVLSAEGYLVTNAHVVAGAQEIQVLLTDERTFRASLVGMDQLSDLAVLYIDATDLIPANFGDSSVLRVGDAVVAIGDPLGVSLRGTMTDGIVSAINRNVQSGGRTMTLIQTNAALNSGNSGGPLINCHGQVIGVNTMKIGTYTDAAGVEGLGFAIPSTVVKEIVDQLIAQGYVSGRPDLPLEGEWISTFHQTFRRLPAGLYITQAPADSGLQAKDILLRVDGVRVTNEEELSKVLYTHEAGDVVALDFYRNGQQFTVQMTLAEAGK